MNSASSEQFQYIRQMAKKFEDAVNAGDVAAEREIRLSVGTVCSYVNCGKPCLSASRDKWTNWRLNDFQQGNYYCSKECQTADWKPISGRSKRPGVYHKDWCKVIRCIPEINYDYPGAAQDEYMPQLPYFQAQLNQFPWGRLERDGTFSNKFQQARFDVLDSEHRKAGFWAVPEQINPHDISDDPFFGASAQPFMQPKDNTNLTGYAHGAMMLALEEWPSDVEGWKLQDEALIPHIFFTGEFPPPARPRPETLEVVNLQHPLGEKQVVDVHYLGAETELNYLPLHVISSSCSLSAAQQFLTSPVPRFSELALFLPNTHINLTVFSPAAHDLLGHAKQRYPRSIAARDGPVWEYTAPRPTGGGSIAISLYHAPPRPLNVPLQLRPFTGVWERSVMMLAPKDPDALVALNAGILSYSTWYEVVSCATMANIPLACTDYAQQSAQMCADHIPEWLNAASRSFSPGENMHQQLVRQRTRPVTVNPFHCPGQRPISQDCWFRVMALCLSPIYISWIAELNLVLPPRSLLSRRNRPFTNMPGNMVQSVVKTHIFGCSSSEGDTSFRTRTMLLMGAPSGCRFNQISAHGRLPLRRPYHCRRGLSCRAAELSDPGLEFFFAPQISNALAASYNINPRQTGSWKVKRQDSMNMA
ncbi:hypothetical protein B0H10DRAFT_2193778 [Mycena sp. CBHHK59/15]|nr:hypothetical protein B0H10DRAFT_2193778 [Mycena sp. CBHHK59/15]